MRTSPALQQIRTGAEPIGNAIEHKPSKLPRVPKAIRHAIRLLTTGECTTVKAAAERAGISREWLSRNLTKDHVRVFAARETRETIAAGMMRASARLVELVDGESEHVSLDATKHMLGIAGIKPASEANVSVSIELKAGYVIDLSEQKPRTVEIIEQNQIEAFPNVGSDGE